MPDPHLIVGVDECGWSALAGPLTACAAYIPGDCWSTIAELGFGDSKRLTPTRRTELAAALQHFPEVAYEVCHVSVADYDALGAAAAWGVAMRTATKLLLHRLDFWNATGVTVLVDGARAIPDLSPQWHQEVKPHADRTDLVVAVASVLGKVARDKVMVQLGAQHPYFGFEQHKGEPTALHLAALWTATPVPDVHRRRLFGARVLKRYAQQHPRTPAWYREAQARLKELKS